MQKSSVTCGLKFASYMCLILSFLSFTVLISVLSFHASIHQSSQHRVSSIGLNWTVLSETTPSPAKTSARLVFIVTTVLSEYIEVVPGTRKKLEQDVRQAQYRRCITQLITVTRCLNAQKRQKNATMGPARHNHAMMGPAQHFTTICSHGVLPVSLTP